MFRVNAWIVVWCVEGTEQGEQESKQMAKRKKTAAVFQVRQGDVLLIRDEGVKTGKEIAPKGGRLILATGETSMHCHAVDAKKARLYELARREEGIEAAVDRCLEIIEQTLVRVESTQSRAHQDERHAPIELPPGKYRVRVMREFDPTMLRSVAD
jgi:hypothetical protein